MICSQDDAGVWPRRAAVIGGGTMGGGIARLLAKAGIRVELADVDREAAKAAVRRLVASVEHDAARELVGPEEPEAIASLIRAASSPANAAQEAQFVVEAVTENPAVKREVYRALEASASPIAVIATNTSAIPIHELARGLTHQERFIGTHWFNPPVWVPAVEVIPHQGTAEAVIQRTCALLQRLGKDPAVVGDSAGFVANRIQFAMFREAAAVVASGVATAEQVDRIVSGSFGFRLPFYGPFAIADMAGLDVYKGAYAALEATFGERFAAPETLLELVDKGCLGTKQGGGYLGLDDLTRIALADERDTRYAALLQLLSTLAGCEKVDSLAADKLET